MCHNGSEPFWLDDVYCRGNESNLLNCNHNPIGEHDCISREAAKVDCKLLYLPVHPTSLLCLHACTAGIGCIIDGIVYKEGEIVPAGDRCNNW